MSYTKPDLNAPRYCSRSYTAITPTFFRRFKRDFPEYAHYTQPQLTKIIKDFDKLIVDTIIEERDGVELPANMGFVFVGACKMNKPPKDQELSAKYGKSIGHRNFESDQFIAKIFYSNYANRHKFKNRHLYQLVGCRYFKRTVAAAFPTNWKKYIQVESFKHINDYFEKKSRRDFAIRFAENKITEYNEFDLEGE